MDGRVGRDRWPLLGRDDLVAAILARLETGSVVLLGEAGVGKTRLASEIGERLAADGRSVEHVWATKSSSHVPFGAFSRLVPAMPTDDLLMMLEHTARAISAGAEKTGLVIMVDDAHELDDPSLALLQRLLAERGLRMVITVRTDSHPSEIVQWWKDELAERFEVSPLDRATQDEVVSHALGAKPEGGLLDRLWELALGRPLFLRELLHAGRQSGAIEVDAVGARLAGELEPSDRLIEIVESRLGALPSAHREVLEALALAEPVPIHIVSRFANPGSLAELERQRLVQTTPIRGVDLARLHHPVYGEVLRSQMSIASRRDLTKRIVSVVHEDDLETPGTALTLASWLMDLGEPPGRDLALRAAREALGRSDPDLARRLALVAEEQQRSVGALVMIGTASSVQGDASAEETLREALDLASEDGDLVEAGLALSRHLVWVERRVFEAAELVGELIGEVSDAKRRSELRVELAAYSAVAGEMSRARDIASEAALDSSSEDPTRLKGFIWSTLASSMLGRFDDIEENLRRGEELGERLQASLPLARDQLQINRVMYQRFVNVRQAMNTVEQGLRQSEIRRGPTGLWHVCKAWMGLPLGLVDEALLSAERGVRDAERFDPFNNLAMARCVRCIALALGRSPEQARQGLSEMDAELLEPRTRTWFDHADVWSLANDGDPVAAASLALDAARRAQDGGLNAWASELAFNAVRLDSPEMATDLLGHLHASMTSAPVLGLYAEGAEAVTQGGSPEIAELARRFEALGERASAVDLLAIASQRSSGQEASRLATEAATLLGHCHGLHTPASSGIDDPLSSRERQVATMAAKDLESRAIADELYLAVRTVDNHLSRVYRKLGLEGRHELASIFLP